MRSQGAVGNAHGLKQLYRCQHTYACQLGQGDETHSCAIIKETSLDKTWQMLQDMKQGGDCLWEIGMDPHESNWRNDVSLWNGLDEESLWRVEREYCAPARRAHKPTADAIHNPLSRCGEILLEPIYTEEVKSSGVDINDAAFAAVAGFHDGATFSKFRRGRYAGQLEGAFGWRKARRLLRAMLLGTDFGLNVELDTSDPRQSIVGRMENYFFGTDDSGPFFAESVMYSPVPSREEEAAYEVLWLANAVRKSEAKGEFIVVSGGEVLVPRHPSSLGPKVALAAAAVGVKCFILYPHPDEFGQTKSRESFLKFASHLPRIWDDPHCRGYVRSISPTLAAQPAPMHNFQGIAVRPCWHSDDRKLWGAQFLQPVLRFVYLHAPVMTEPRFLMLRAPGLVPFCWVGANEEAHRFKQWADMVLARHEEEVGKIGPSMKKAGHRGGKGARASRRLA